SSRIIGFSAQMTQPTQPPYRCFIETEKQAYFPGDKLSCNTELTFDRRFPCEEILAVFTGEARVFWIEKLVGEKAVCRHQTFYQKRALFEQKKRIWSADLIDVNGRKKSSSISEIVRFSSPNAIRTGNLLTGEKKREFRGLEAGKHNIPLEFTIPEDGIYSSMEVDEELVSVRYQIEIHCLVEGRITKKFRQLIHVYSPRDLSEESDRLTIPKSEEKMMESKIGRLTATLILPKTGFIPTEPLNAQIVVNNMTSSSVKFASVCIVKKIVAFADQPRFEVKEREDETAGSILPFPKILRGERKEWIAQMHVPALPPNLCIDDFMHVNYYAKLSVGFDRGSRKKAVLHLTVPITIGTVAIDSVLPDALPSKTPEKTSFGDVDNGSDVRLRNRKALPTVLPTAPPSYDEVMSSSTNGTFSPIDDAPLPYWALQRS
ncbi:hypothetical protein PFISCL1PPCAC_6863, partial [Pristionchus fissidentatus]